MGERISGKSFDVNVGDLLVHVSKTTLDITDNRTTTKTNGVPDGYVDGDVSAAGEMEVDTANFNLIIDAAKAAGSFKQLDAFDQVFYAKAGEDELKVEAFGCLLKISSLLDIDKNGGDKTMHKLPFEVTSPDFIKINGVPYLSKEETEGIG